MPELHGHWVGDHSKCPDAQRHDLNIIVPSRGRPESLPRVVKAWVDTGAFADADLTFVVDRDDPFLTGYVGVPYDVPCPGLVHIVVAEKWQPMVPKLNEAAVFAAGPFGRFALGFAGDDHLPRTHGWAGRYLDALHSMGTGIVYGDDRLQGQRLPTQWAMTADIVRALGRMVPADVEHLYCDNAVLALGRAAGCIRYIGHVVIEHMHPIASKAEMDDGYAKANAPAQYERDHAAFRRYLADGLADDVRTVKALRTVRAG